MNTFINESFRQLADSDYKAFNAKLITTQYPTIGIRMPAMKKLSKEIAHSPDVEEYLNNAQFATYEHVLLYGLVIGQLRNATPQTVFRYLDPLILKFDNWAHVDTVISSIKICHKHQDEVLTHILPLKYHNGEFARRTFVVFLMDFYMDHHYIDATLKHLAEVPQGEYYVDMAIAWALSVALVKHYNKTIPLIENKAFSTFVHNKAIQKARESYRISPEIKEFLNGLKIKPAKKTK